MDRFSWDPVRETPIPQGRARPEHVEVAVDMFAPDVLDGVVMNTWRMMGLLATTTFWLSTNYPERMAAWIKRWADVEEKDQAPKMARGPEAIRKVHTSGRALLFADMLETWGTPPGGAAYPTYDWAEGLCWWPNTLDNVRLGLRATNQSELDAGVAILSRVPASFRWLDLVLGGPLKLGVDIESTGNRFGVFGCPACRGWGAGETGSVDANSYPQVRACQACWGGGRAIDHVRLRGETGPEARPLHPAWALYVRDQCAAAHVAFEFTSWGEWNMRTPLHRDDEPIVRLGEHGRDTRDLANCTPEASWEVYMQRVGVDRSGRLLEDHLHDGEVS